MRRVVRLLVLVNLVLSGILVGVEPAQAAGAAYTITDLGTLGGSGSSASGVNEAGDVAGTSNTARGEPHAFRWSAGVLTGIHAMGGFGAEGNDISDDGWVVGSAGNNDGYAEAMYWFGADPHPAGTLGDTWSQAFAINASHQIVGRSANAAGIIEAFSWQGGVMVGLGGLVDGDYSEAHDVNDHGVIVGEAGAVGGAVHAFRHAGGVMTDLGTPSPNFADSWARGVNKAEAVVGGVRVTNSDAVHPFVRSASGAWDVVTEVVGVAEAINGSGQVVGTAFGPAGETAFIYEAGVVTDLNSLMPSGSGWWLAAALDINDRGQIVGQGTLNGEGRGFLLTPVGSSADLGVSLTASPDPLLAGTVATFTARITNSGPSTATSVRLDVQLPVNHSSVQCVAPGGTCGGTGASRFVTYSSLAAGASVQASFLVASPVSAADGAAYGAAARVSAAEPDPAATNNEATASVTISNNADLAVTGTANRDRVKQGQVITQSFVVQNHGPGAAGTVMFQETLAAGLQVLGTTSPHGCATTETSVTCRLLTVPAGASIAIGVEVRVTAGGGASLDSVATVSSPNHDPTAGNDTAILTVRTTGKPGR